MTSSTWTQIRINLWKSWIVRKRKPFLWTFEVAWPLAIVIIASLLHIWMPPSEFRTCQFRARANPSAGLVPYMQSMVCNIRNNCHNISNYEDIPTYPESIFQPLVTYGQNIFMDEYVNKALENLTTMVDILKGIAISFNTIGWKAIFEDQVFVYDFFVNETNVKDFLVETASALSPVEGDVVIKSRLNLTRIVEDTSLVFLLQFDCSVESVARFVITQDLYTLESLTEAVCGRGLSDDTLAFIRVIQKNVDVQYVADKANELYDLVIHYSWFSLIGDMGDFFGIVITIPSLDKHQSDIPPILHFELWFHDLEDTVKSIALNYDHFDWTVFDSIDALTLQFYLNDYIYDDIIDVIEVLTLELLKLRDSFSDCPGQIGNSDKEDDQEKGTWEEFADVIEDLIRILVEESNEDCISEEKHFKDVVSCGAPTFSYETSSIDSAAGGINSTSKGPQVFDYFYYFFQGALAEFHAENPPLLKWVDYTQSMLETLMITSANLSKIDTLIVESFPEENECVTNFTRFFTPPNSKLDDPLLPESWCEISAVIAHEKLLVDLDDPFILTIVNMTYHDVPVTNATYTHLYDTLVDVILGIIDHGWPLYNPVEFQEALQQVRYQWAENTIDDFVKLIQDILLWIESLTGSSAISLYGNATMATIHVLVHQVDYVSQSLINSTTEDTIYFSISDFFVDMPHIQLVIDDSFNILPSLLEVWSKEVEEGNLIQVLDDVLNLTSSTSDWPCGSTSILDFWELDESVRDVVDELEDQLCHADQLVDEFLHIPLIFDMIEIWKATLNNGSFDFEWQELSSTLNKCIDSITELNELSKNHRFWVAEIGKEFQRSGARFIVNLYTFLQRLFKEGSYVPSKGYTSISSHSTAGIANIIRCLDATKPCLKGDISGFALFLTEVLKSFESYHYLSILLFYTPFSRFLSKQIPILIPTGEAFRLNGIEVEDVVRDLVELGMTMETAKEFGNSFLNLNRISFLNYNIGNVAQDIYDPLKFSSLFKFQNATSYDFVRNDMLVTESLLDIAALIVESVNNTAIEDLLKDDRQANFFAFDWFQLLVGICNEVFRDLNNFKNMLAYLIPSVDKLLQNTPDIRDVLEFYATVIRNDALSRSLDSLLGFFDGLGTLLINVNASEDVFYIRRRLRDIRFIHLIDLAMFQLPIHELMKDWNEVSQSLEDNLNVSKAVAESIGNADLDIPKLLLPLSIPAILAYEVVCNATELEKYLVFPEEDFEVSYEDISSGICEMNATNSIDFASVFVGETNFEDLFRTVSSVTLEKILANANVSEEMGKKTLNAFADAIDILNKKYYEEVEALYLTIEEFIVNATNPAFDFDEYAGLMVCGERGAFSFLNVGLFSGQDDFTETFGSRNAELYDHEYDPCKAIENELVSTSVGKIVWKQIAGFLQGDILYTPDNKFTSEIMSRANASYARMQPYLKSAYNFLSIGKAAQMVAVMQEEFLVLDMVISSSVTRAFLEKFFEDPEIWIPNNIVNIPDILMRNQNSLKAMELAGSMSRCYRLDRITSVSSEVELVRQSQEKDAMNRFYGGIVFWNDGFQKYGESFASDFQRHFKYKIRLGEESVPNTEELKPPLWIPGPDGDFILNLQYLRGFLQMQDLVDSSIFEYAKENLGLANVDDDPLEDVGIYTQEFPYPCFERDNFLSGVYTVQLVQVLLFFGFAMTFVSSLRFQLWEKESQNFQIMQVMGMKDSVAWMVWLFISFTTMLVMTFFLTIILKYGGLIPKSDPFLLFFMILGYALSLISFCFIMAASLNKATTGSVISILLYIVTFIPFAIIVTNEDSLVLWHKILMYFIMSTSFCHAAMYVTRYEQQGIGLHWNNVWSSPIEQDETNFGIALLFTYMDFILYSLIAILILYLKGHNTFSVSFKKILNLRANKDLKEFINRSNSVTSDVVDTEVNGIRLRGLTKIYQLTNDQYKIAVNHLNLDFKMGEITSLLGHNGAGKSTTMKMVTGLEPPTSGKINIFGYIYPKDWPEIQKLLGFCPQHGILYPDLSVKEHLKFYSYLKGTLSEEEMNAEVEHFLKTMDMEELQNEPVKNLSEGMQRRVCVSLAFIGGSKVVVLDEPTAGVDPPARKKIWDLISTNKEGRVIILSTHHLDEAEILSDRIAIIHKGKLLTLGTLGILKDKFKQGYNLFISLKNKKTKENILAQVKKRILNVESVRDNEDGLKMFVPSNGRADFKNRVIQLLQFLENEAPSYFGLKHFTFTRTSLEEVFTELITSSSSESETSSSDESSDNRRNEISSVSRQSIVSSDNSSSIGSEIFKLKLLTGWRLHLNQFYGLLYKRYKHAHRDWRFLFSAFCLPSLFIILCLLLTMLRPMSYSPALLLTPSLYGPEAKSFLKFQDTSDLNEILQRLIKPPGIGTTCMDNFPDNPDDFVYSPCLASNQDYFATNYTGPGSIMRECGCEKRDWVCHEDVLAKSAPRLVSNTTDILYDISNLSVTVNEWLLNTHQEFIDQRFGGWSAANWSEYADLINGSPDNLVVWYNNKAPHALPSYVNSIRNAMLRHLAVSAGQDPTDFGISTFVHPIRLTDDQIISQTFLQNVTDFGIAVLLMVAFSFLPASCITYLIRERKNEEKQVQMVAGVPIVLYWSAAFIWDIMMTLAFIVVTSLILLAFQTPSYTARDNFTSFLLLLFFFCTSSTSLAYCVEKLFREPSFGQMTVLCLNVLFGIVTLLIMVLLDALYMVQAAQDFKYVINYFFLLIPSYSLGEGLVGLATNQIVSDIYASLGDEEKYRQPLEWTLIGRNVTFMASQSFIFFFVNLAIEYRIINVIKSYVRQPKPIPAPDFEEEDVQIERERAEDETKEAENILTIRNLTRVFKTLILRRNQKVAVNNISVGIRRGECFGWLGQNGAGKSTTFKMLTGALDKTSGNVHFGRNTIMGYCPQEQALDDFLTVREVFKFYSLIRGIPKADSKSIIQKAISDMTLELQLHTKCSGLSGGTKRKVCSANAFMGNPQLILMDEPTSGMDILTRRQVWNIIKREVKSGRSVILTSHSMDECEKLCTRLAIMSSGQFQCLGSPTHLKRKYGQGYMLQVTVKSEHYLGVCLSFIRDQFRDITNLKQYYKTIRCQIFKDKISEIYSVMLCDNDQLGIKDFSIAPASLDEVFISFANSSDHDGGRISLNFANLSRDLEPERIFSSNFIDLDRSEDYNL